jgi:hypothetical protein
MNKGAITKSTSGLRASSRTVARGTPPDIPARSWSRHLQSPACRDAQRDVIRPSAKSAVWQLINTLAPYVLLWRLMHLTLDVSLWLTVVLAVVAGAFLVRVFIIFHDCGHESFFSSRRAFRLWDEQTRKLVGYARVRQLEKE